jgi:hypothetical protein
MTKKPERLAEGRSGYSGGGESGTAALQSSRLLKVKHRIMGCQIGQGRSHGNLGGMPDMQSTAGLKHARGAKNGLL